MAQVIVVTAHPDDLETGPTGLVIKLVRAGHSVVSIVCNTGQKDEAYQSTRKAESEKAHALLETPCIQMDYQDGGGLSVDEKTRGNFQRLINNFKPELVIAHWGMDVHPDHRAASMLAIEPCLLKGINTELWCFEVCSGVGRKQSLGFNPTHYVELDHETLDLKQRMLYCHASQGPEEIWAGHTEMHEHRGRECKSTHAEGYVRLTRTPEPPDFLKNIVIPSAR